MLHVAVLGSVSSRRGETQWDTLAPGARQLLAILVAAGPNGLSVERAADELWPAGLPPTWGASLRMAFTRLRRCLPQGALATKGGWCRLELDQSRVDIWQLTDQVNATALDGEKIVTALAQEAFPSVEVCSIVRIAIDQFDLLRITLLDRILDENIPVPRMATAQLRAFADTRDWDTALSSRAIELLNRSTTESQASPRSGIERAPTSLAQQLPSHHVGRHEVIREIVELVHDEGKPVVTMEAGRRSGRTSTLAAVGAHLSDAGWRIIHLRPAQPPAAFAPLLQALPELRTPILRALDSDDPPTQIRTRCWTSVLQAIDDGDAPTCLIVDDAEQLDASSEEALGFIARSTTVQRVAIVGGVDPEHPRAKHVEWPHSVTVEIEPLGPADVAALIGHVHAESSELQRVKLGSEIAITTKGRAADVAHLVHSMDSRELMVPAAVAAAGRDEFPQLDETTRRVTVAASIIGDRASLRDLEHLTGQPSHLVLTSVDALIGQGILTETSRPDEFELAPIHRLSDLSDTIEPDDLREMHRQAMTLSRLDPVAVAHHARAAQPHVDDAAVADAQIAAALWLIEASRDREAVSHFRFADDLGAGLGVEELVAYARCLEFIGQSAIGIRRRAVEVATAQGRSSAALDAAVGGLPASESLEGDEELAALIRSIDLDGLSREEQLRRHLHLSRQLLLLSDKAGAEAEMRRGEALAESVAEEADVWLAASHIGGWQPEGDHQTGFRPVRFTQVDHIEDPVQRARLHQATAVSALIAGDFGTASEIVDDLRAAAEASGDPLRRWHAGVIDVTLALNELRFEEAERLADQWRDHGVAYGLHGAVATRLAQRANTASLVGSGHELIARLHATAPDAKNSALARAGMSRLLARSGRTEDALTIAGQVLDEVSGSRFETGVLGVLAVAVGRAAPTMAARIRDGLDPHRGKVLIIGAGVNSIGPVEGLLADVTIDDSEALALRQQAVELADRWSSPLWQILSRVELGRENARLDEHTTAQRILDEAAERAEGTELEQHERLGLFEH